MRVLQLLLKCEKNCQVHEIFVFFTELLLSEGSLVKGAYVGVTFELEEGEEGGSNFNWEWRG